jgi:hypothetical protein
VLFVDTGVVDSGGEFTDDVNNTNINQEKDIITGGAPGVNLLLISITPVVNLPPVL